MSSHSKMQLLAEVRRQWRLVYQFAHQEFIAKYRGSMLGACWAVALPLLMLTVYTFVFSVIFTPRWQGNPEQGNYFFALMIFAGLIPFNLFAESFASAPRLVQGNPNLVKRVVFPLEILPPSRVLAVLLQQIISVVILLGAVAWLGHLSINALAFPLVLLPMALFSAGLVYLFASLGVFVRDIGHFAGVLISLAMFLSPVFYPASAVPAQLKPYLFLNPLAMLIEQFRNLLVLGVLPSIGELASAWAIGVVFFVAGLWFFLRTKRAFADVM